MYNKLFFEISGFCQARCPHCCTGNKSLRAYSSRFIPVPEFIAAIDRLLDLGLIGEATQCELYNWGEPFLHPELLEILKVLSDRSLRYRLSTNAGKHVSLPEHLIRNMNQLTITIPGFSQKSYDRVHGLNFLKVMENIDRFKTDVGAEKVRITYLLHQFNINEIREANAYFRTKRIRMTNTVAYMNDYHLSRDYLTGRLPPDRLQRAGRDLLLYYVEDLLRQRPADFRCPQFTILALDEFCNVLTCCMVPKSHPDYTLGPIFSLSTDQVKNGKEHRAVCRECQGLGIDYWCQTGPQIDFCGYLTGDYFRTVEIAAIALRKIKTILTR